MSITSVLGWLFQSWSSTKEPEWKRPIDDPSFVRMFFIDAPTDALVLARGTIDAILMERAAQSRHN